MKRPKKKFFLISSITLIFSLLLFFAIFFTNISSYIFCWYFQKTYNTKIKYENFCFSHGKFCVRELILENNSYDVFVDKLKVKVGFDIKRFQLKFDIKVFAPQINLIDLSQFEKIQKESLVKNRFIKNNINIKNGQIKLKNENFAYFNISQEKFSALTDVIIAFDKDFINPIIFNIQKYRNIGVFFENLNLSNLNPFFEACNFNLKNFKGILSGNLSFENSLKDIKGQLVGNDINFLDNVSKNIYRLKNINLEIKKPKGTSKNSLINTFFNQVVALNIDGGKISSIEEKNILDDMYISLNYDPSLGVKLYAKALASYKDRKVPLHIDTKGYLNSHFNNWIDCCIYFGKENHPLLLKVCEEKKGVSFSGLFKDFDINNLNIFLKLYPNSYITNGEFKNGKINGNFEITVNEKKIISLGTKDLILKNLEMYFPSVGEVFFEYLQLSSKIFIADIFNSILNFDLKKGNITNINLESFPITNISNLSCEFFFENKEVKNISFDANIDGVDIIGKGSGGLDEAIYSFDINGTSKNILKHSIEDFLKGTISLNLENKCFSICGNINLKDEISKEQNIAFKCELDLLEYIKKKKISFIKNGTISLKNIPINKTKIFYKERKDISLSGLLNASATVEKNILELRSVIKDFSFKDDLQSISIKEFGDTKDLSFKNNNHLYVRFDIAKQKLLENRAPIISGDYRLNKFDLNFHCYEAKPFYNGNFFIVYLPKVISNDILMDGKVIIDFSEEKNNLLKIDVNSAKGNIQDLVNFSDKFISIDCKKEVSGTFQLNEKGAYFSKQLSANTDFLFDIDIDLQDLNYLVNDDIQFSNITSSINYSNYKKEIDLFLDGSIAIYGKKFSLKNISISQKKEDFSFDVNLDSDFLTVCSLNGNIYKNNDVYNVDLSNRSNLFGSNFNSFIFEMEENFDISKVNISTDINLDRCFSYLGLNNKVSSLNVFGDIDLNLFLDKKNEFFLSLKSEEITIDDYKIDNFLFSSSYIDKLIKNKLYLKEDCVCSFDIDLKDKSYLDILNFNVLSDVVSLSSFGRYFYNEKKLDLKLDEIKIESLEKWSLFSNFFEKKRKKNLDFLDFDLSLEGYGWLVYGKNGVESDFDFSKLKIHNEDHVFSILNPINLHYSSNRGLDFSQSKIFYEKKGQDLGEISLDFKFSNYDIKSKKVSLENGKLYLSKKGIDYFYSNQKNNFLVYLNEWLCIDKDIDFNFDFEYFLNENQVKIFSKQSILYLNNSKRVLENINLYYKNKYFYLDFDLLINQNRHYFSSKTDLNLNLEGKIMLGRNTDPLTVYWNINDERLFISKICGKYMGISADFINVEDEDYINLIGIADIDFSKALLLFPKEIIEKYKRFKIGDGYQFKGHLLLNNFDLSFEKCLGIFTGKDFNIFGYNLNNFYSEIDIKSSSTEIKNITVSDLSGILNIEKILIDRKGKTFDFSIPQIAIKECRPSLISKQKKQIKPLIIRQFYINDLSGNLSDPSSIKGEGRLSFINSFKRNHTILEVPADIMGRILGLDLELLIPVCGQLCFKIEEEKIIFTKATDVYSENNRSKFFLMEKPYISFNGDLNIFIKMKQYVLFKITEKFILSLEGNISDPKFNMKKRKERKKDLP